MRENTERPITVTQGTSELVGAGDLAERVSRILRGEWKKGSVPDLWDGHTAERAVQGLKSRTFPYGEPA